MTNLDLSSVEPIQQEWAVEAFESGNMEGFTGSAYSRGGCLAIVLDNIALLRQRGYYEAAMVHGFIGCKINNATWPLEFLDRMFRCGDRAKLQAVGDPLPGAGPFTLYRGVSGTGRAKRIRGLSWTDSLDAACWFAMRFKFPSPAVHTATVTADEIYCFSNHRREREFICRPKQCKPVKLTAEQMGEAADRHTAVVRESNKQSSRNALEARC